MDKHEFKVDCYGTPWSVVHSVQEQILLQAQDQGGHATTVYNHGTDTLTVKVYGSPEFRLAYEAAVRDWFARR